MKSISWPKIITFHFNFPCTWDLDYWISKRLSHLYGDHSWEFKFESIRKKLVGQGLTRCSRGAGPSRVRSSRRTKKSRSKVSSLRDNSRRMYLACRRSPSSLFVGLPPSYSVEEIDFAPFLQSFVTLDIRNRCGNFSLTFRLFTSRSHLRVYCRRLWSPFKGIVRERKAKKKPKTRTAKIITTSKKNLSARLSLFDLSKAIIPHVQIACGNPDFTEIMHFFFKKHLKKET